MTRFQRDSDPDLQLSATDLRNAASPAAIERVWQRLEDSAFGRRRKRSASVLLWTASCSLATFLVGLWFGAGMSGAGVGSTTPRAEPRGLPAAGNDREVAILGTEAVAGRALSARDEGATRNLGVRHPRRAQASQVAPDAVTLEEAVPPDDVPAPRSSVVNSEAVPPVWQRLANGGEYEAALFELGQTGGFEQAIGHSNAEQLMLLYDVARATGQHQRALAALRRIVGEFPNDAVAPLAAWSLGNLLETVGDVEGARAAYSMYRVLSPAGEFAEDALVRQIRNAVTSADSTLLARLVTQYDSDFPEGRRRLEVARLTATGLSAPDAGSQSGRGASEAEVDTPASP
jgi:TolA-binding protein